MQHHHHDEGETAPERGVHRREEDLHTHSLLTEDSDAHRNGVRIDHTATSATVIESNGPNIRCVTPAGEALLRSALEKSRNPVPPDHLRVLPSGTSNGF